MSQSTPSTSSSMFLIPAMPPPPGTQSNFTDPETNATTIRILNGLFLGLAFVLLLVRLFIRTTLPQNHKLGWDDWLCTVAVVASIVHTVLVYLVLELGYGRHFWDVQAISITHGKLVIFALVDMAYVVAVFLIKFSILLLYHRLFAIYAVSKRLIIVGYTSISLIMAGTLGNSIARVTVCTNIQTASTIPFCSGKNVNIVLIVVAVLNAVADFYILVIPVHRVAKIHTLRKKKAGVLVIFLGGLIACTMSLVRLAVITENLHSTDVLWNGSRVTPFTIIEMNLGIICSCMMFIPPFFTKSKVVIYSMKSALLSRTGMSLSKARSVESQIYTGEPQSQPQANTTPQQEVLEAWEKQTPDLELLAEVEASGVVHGH
ncbi:hypothetical protein P171DRAFT_25331 [Karstenula rhodostoma CBS 690.94]|uniref:Rhodopsin domain-containing protein n=1 Tax=Karstenula rhodostoma CBS 690.94 TaxID=1392251 RepID=A0A9P4PJL9_9PLEO|nr:hypothetical protein P171DRAFT_25331 [Karstenula rhodostoma CBS 690.94]